MSLYSSKGEIYCEIYGLACLFCAFCTANVRDVEYAKIAIFQKIGNLGNRRHLRPSFFPELGIQLSPLHPPSMGMKPNNSPIKEPGTGGNGTGQKFEGSHRLKEANFRTIVARRPSSNKKLHAWVFS